MRVDIFLLGLIVGAVVVSIVFVLIWKLKKKAIIVEKDAELNGVLTQKDHLQLLYEQAEAHAKRWETQALQYQQSISVLQSDKARLEVELQMLRQQVETAALEREKRFAEQLRLAKEELKTLSQSILEDKQKHLQEGNKTQIAAVLLPLEKEIIAFKNRVNEIHEKNVEDRACMTKELENLRKMNETISKEANDLTHALKGETKIQGNWGEMILEKQLEFMGFIEGKHYVKQSFIEDENGFVVKTDEGKQLQPDIIIKYPQGREVIIDSKVSLTNYVEYVSATDDISRSEGLKKHMASVRKHIVELSKKQYGKHSAGRSPEFVLMFMPNESAYITAIREDESLWNFAFEKRIVLVGPSTILSALHLALDLWKREDQSANVKKIIEEVNKLYDKVALFCRTFKVVGDNLATMQKSYEVALGQLVEGRGNIVSRFENVKKMGLSPKNPIALKAEE